MDRLPLIIAAPPEHAARPFLALTVLYALLPGLPPARMNAAAADAPTLADFLAENARRIACNPSAFADAWI